MSQEPMISEIFSEQDLLAFDEALRRLLKEPGCLQYVVEPKITAVEVWMTYEKGSLRSASTQGWPVTASIKTILTVPLTFIPLRKERAVPDVLEVRAGVYMEHAALARLNQGRRAKDLPSFCHATAAVEDSLLQSDPRISTKRPLNYFCTGAANTAALQAATHYELMIALQELGLRVNRPHMHVSDGIQEAAGHCRRLRAETGNFPYPVEGALVRVNSLDLQERSSHGSENLPEAVVFRF